jgi:hypothetical protein
MITTFAPRKIAPFHATGKGDELHMTNRILWAGLAFATLSCSAWSAETGGARVQPPITTFTIKLSREANPVAINASGTVTGYWTGSSGTHGFVRATDGTVTGFDPPNSERTTPYAINASGTVTGTFQDTGGTFHGFVRTSDGTLTVIDAPGAGSRFEEGTTLRGINSAGMLTGYYVDNSGGLHAFIESADGTVTPVSDPGDAGTTEPSGINDSGTIIGTALQSGVPTAFAIASDGTASSFTCINGQSSFATGINESGVITGYCTLNTGTTGIAGFVRASDGTLTPFDIHGSFNTIPTGINAAGQIVGDYATLGSNKTRGFVRRPVGAVTTFAVTDAVTGVSLRTTPAGINDSGAITGTGGQHQTAKLAGFVRAAP